MEMLNINLLFFVITSLIPIIVRGSPVNTNVQVYKPEPEVNSNIWSENLNLRRQQPRLQEEGDEDDDTTSAPVPSSTPFIPAIIPGLTKIFQGIITGNLNDIFHGGSSFAPQNVSHAIDSVYNQVVGLAPPVSTAPTTRRPPQEEAVPAAPAPAATEKAPAPMPFPEAKEPLPVRVQPSAAAPASPAARPAAPQVNQGSIVITTSSVKPVTASREDDEDEDTDLFGFRGFDRNGNVRI